MITAEKMVKVATHPLVQQLLAKLRDYQTPSSEFSYRAAQISRYLMYEAFSDLNVREIGVETPARLSQRHRFERLRYSRPGA